jgi:hypothetical protein
MPWLHVEPTRARFGALQRDLGPRRRVLRRVPPHSGELAAASCLHASWIVGSLIYGANQIKGYPFGAVHRGPVRRVHVAVHRTRARPRPLDLRSTVRLWRFLLRAPEQFRFRMPVLVFAR